MHEIHADVCVIGAGAGGLSVAAGCARFGARVVLVEAGEMGGDCLNRGCVPSKALLAAAARARELTSARRLGVAGGAADVDFPAVMDHVHGAVRQLAAHDGEARFRAMGVEVIRARARFAGPDRVEAGGRVIRARRFVIATGARPVLPPVPGLEAVSPLTSDNLWDLDALPRRLAVIGGGAIGCELAQGLARLGAEVTLIEAGRLLPGEDAEAVALLRESLRRDGVTLRENARVSRAARAPEGVRLDLDDGQLEADHILVAAGRRPNIEGLGLEAAGVAADAQGIRVDRGLRTGNRRIFAIGDCAGGPQFTHMAAHHAAVVVRRILFGLPARARTDHLPRVLYTDPEIARIGPTEAEARERHGDGIEVVRIGLEAVDRAVAEGRTEGFLRLVVRRGRPIGVTICAPEAGELIAPWAVAFARRLPLSALAGVLLPYPTRSEILTRAVGAHLGPRVFQNRLLRRIVRLVQRL